jgi:hypothetical protein
VTIYKPFEAKSGAHQSADALGQALWQGNFEGDVTPSHVPSPGLKDRKVIYGIYYGNQLGNINPPEVHYEYAPIVQANPRSENRM